MNTPPRPKSRRRSKDEDGSPLRNSPGRASTDPMPAHKRALCGSKPPSPEKKKGKPLHVTEVEEFAAGRGGGHALIVDAIRQACLSVRASIAVGFVGKVTHCRHMNQEGCVICFPPVKFIAASVP